MEAGRGKDMQSSCSEKTKHVYTIVEGVQEECSGRVNGSDRRVGR